MPCRRGVLLSMILVSGSLLGCEDSAAEKAKLEKPKPPIAVPGAVDADAPEEFTTTDSGLKYRIRRKSDGKKPTDGKVVTVHYRGWLDDGNIFDTSYGTMGTPKPFDLKQLIPGWGEGLKLIGEGGMIELEIPGKLGYGERGAPPYIGPNATLHFLVELIKVADPAAPPESPAKTAPKAETIKPGPTDPDAPEEFMTTESGLKYRIRRKSTGKKPDTKSSVTVHYRGWLDNGSVFDTSYDLGQPADFGVTQVIPGWTEGLQLIGEGGMIELEIPSNLGYGTRGQPPQIPPNATLHFIVELIKVK